MELSKKIRQGKANGHRWLMIAAGIVFFLFFFIAALPCRPVMAYSVAVFDFDKRDMDPDPLAYYIENKLKAAMPGIEVTHFSGLGDEARSIRILSELDAAGYDLIITRTSDALIIAQHTVLKTPTLYTNVNNPLLLGFQTLGPQGGNISGASYYIPVRKHLEVYKAIQPGLKKPGFIFDLGNKSRKVEVPEIRDVCADMGLEMTMEFIDRRDQLRAAAEALIARGVDSIISASSGRVYENISSFIDVTDNAGIPVYSFYKTGVEEGAVAALSSDFFRMADELLVPMAKKVLVDKVSPGDMPAAFLKKNILFLNRKQLQKLGITIPDEITEQYEIKYIP